MLFRFTRYKDVVNCVLTNWRHCTRIRQLLLRPLANVESITVLWLYSSMFKNDLYYY